MARRDSSKDRIRREKTEARPEEAGFDPRKLERLDDHFLGLLDRGEIQAASYLLARRGKIFARAAMGRLHYRRGGEFTVDSLRMIGSITKLITAIALLMLWERGRFNLYAPVAEILPEFDTPAHRGIYPYHLLSHTSGLRADEGYFQEPYHLTHPAQPANWIRSLLEGPPQSEPGKAWAYSSRAFTILGEIVGRASSRRYADYVTENIFRPLKMGDTLFTVPPEKGDRLCVTRRLEEEWFAEWEKTDAPYPPSAYQVFSTLPDLYRLAGCLLNNGELEGFRLLGRKTIEDMRRNQLRDVPAFHWGRKFKKYRCGLGARLIQDDFGTASTFGHEGLGASSLFVDPENELVCIFFAPSASGWPTEAMDNSRAVIWSGLL